MAPSLTLYASSFLLLYTALQFVSSRFSLPRHLFYQPKSPLLLPSCDLNDFSTSIFSIDPLVIYLTNFIKAEEAAHLVQTADPLLSESKIVNVNSNQSSTVDKSFRSSRSAILPQSNSVVSCVQQRALALQGYLFNASVEPLQVVKYGVGDHVRNHHDWLDKASVARLNRFGKRDTSIFAYLEADCEGGGTSFPMLKRPRGDKWCDVIDCNAPESEGVVFKPIKGNAIFWQNWDAGGNIARHDSLHSGQKLVLGTKVGLNIWASSFSD